VPHYIALSVPFALLYPIPPPGARGRSFGRWVDTSEGPAEGVLGHASASTTQVYAKIVDRMTENLARYLEAMLGAQALLTFGVQFSYANSHDTRQSMVENLRVSARASTSRCWERSQLPLLCRRRAMDHPQRCPMATAARIVWQSDLCRIQMIL
jgi:hypothetical protein